MASFSGDSTNEQYRHANASSKSASPVHSTPGSPTSSTSSTADSSLSFQLCEKSGGLIQRYTGTTGIRKAIDALREKLRNDETTNQYLVFRPVTANEFNEMELGKGIRLTYCADLQTLIIKVPTLAHEMVTRNFEAELMERFFLMSVPRGDRYGLCGSTTFNGALSSNEADGSFKPAARPRKLDWPTLVLEVGVSESLPKLRIDARWWLSNSGGSVKIVLIFHVNGGTKTIRIEKWENAPAIPTRSNPSPTQTPTKMQEIIIRQNSVTGAPLTLDFHQMFLRQPNAPEQDLLFTGQDLQAWANGIWALLI